jgi:hypothetical protein
VGGRDLRAHTPRRSQRPGCFHHLRAAEPPTDHTGIEEFVSRYVQLYVPQVKVIVSGLTCPVAAVVVDIFCTTLLDAPQELGVPAYVFLISSAAMAAVLLRSPSLDEEVGTGVEFEELEGGLDVPGLPPVPASCLLMGLDNKKISTCEWFLYYGRRYMETNGIMINTIAELEPSVLAAIPAGDARAGSGPRRYIRSARWSPSRHGSSCSTSACGGSTHSQRPPCCSYASEAATGTSARTRCTR